MSPKTLFCRVLLAVGATLASTANVFAQCPPAANIAAPQQPSNTNLVSGVQNVTYSWSAATAAGVTGYDVFVSKVGSGNITLACSGAANATSCNGGGLSDGTWEWGIRTKTSTCVNGVDSQKVNFTVGCALGTPSTISPANLATNVSTSVQLSWSSVSRADSYDIYFGAVGQGCTAGFPVGTSSGTTFNPPTLQGGTQYEWRVVARRSGCPGTTSSCVKFTTAQSSCPTATATNVAPAANATLTSGSPVTFSWTGVANATGYEVIVSSDNGATSRGVGNVSGSATSLNATLVDGSYLWIVKATFANCTPTTSPATHFTIATKSCFTAAPHLSEPANNATNVAPPVHFEWDGVTGASLYRLYAAYNGGNAAILTIGRETEFTTSVPNGTSVEWYVIASSDNCATESTHNKFTTSASGCPSNPGTPKTVSPVDGATNLASPVTFSWTAVSGATSYRVIGTGGVGESFLIGTTTATQLTAPVPVGTLTWVVQAVFGDCPASTISPRATITVITGSACNNAAPTLTSPANGATLKSPVELKWNPVSGATAYKVYAGVDNATPDLLAVTTDTSVTRIVPKGTIRWFVDAVFVGCPDVRSATSTFNVVADHVCGTGTLTLSTPASGATVQSPVALGWLGVTGANAYRVYVSVDGSSPALVARTAQPGAIASIPNGVVDWYVEAVFTDCDPIVSAKGRFTVAKGTNCDTHVAPAPIAPAAGAGTLSPVEFSWSPSAGAVAYRVSVASNNQPAVDFGFTKETKLTHEVPPGSASWFVEAFFDGCPVLASARTSFNVTRPTPRCSSEAPAPISPADGSTGIGSPVSFSWSGVEDARAYRVYAAVAGGQIVQIATTTETSFDRSLPPGNYSWLIEAVFEGCSSTKSSIAHFTVAQRQNCTNEAPRLLAPADHASVSGDVDFAWAPVSGATGYAVWVKARQGAAAVIGNTQDTHLLRKLPDADIEWWVVAFITGCNSVESEHFDFTVKSSDSCLHKRPVLLTPPDGERDQLSPLHFSWTAVAQATSYKVWASLGRSGPGVVGTTTATSLTADAPAGVIHWYVEAIFDGCPSTESAVSEVTVAGTPPPCGTPEKPLTTVVGRTVAGTQFGVRWTALGNVKLYEVQEATKPDFSNATTRTATGVTWPFTRTVTTPTQFYYRVRGISNCNDESGPYSDVVTTIVTPTSSQPAVEVGTQGGVIQSVFVAGPATPTQFTARGDKPWMTVTPASGTIGPAGLTFTVTFDPSALPLGTTTGSIVLTYGSAGKFGSNAGGFNFPVSISLVTPVAPTPKNTPPPDSLIIPAVGHAQGAGASLFQSDVRVSNTGAQSQRYQLNFTLSRTDGTETGQSTTIEVEPGATTALDDILTSFFGSSTDASVTGVLEIRPLDSSSSASAFSQSTVSAVAPQTVASSRTYNQTANGTFGQFIPAIPFASFIGKSESSAPKQVLSLQQIAESLSYRTNFGLVEGSGEAADVLVSVFNNANQKLKEIPLSLLPGEHRQLNGFLSANGVSVTDGRIEVEVTSSTGRVTAYASVLDNATSDPLLVSPVLKGSTTSARYVVPGVADLNNGIASWRTDLRIFNDSAVNANATLTYYPQLDPGNAVTRSISLAPGEVRAVDNSLQSLFNLTNSGGAIALTGASNLIVTARTYNQTSNGTYGQFIPAVTPAESVGSTDDRSLQLLQLEHSDRFRTNIGLSETTGNPATAEVSVILSDSKVIPVIQIPLQANEFRQFSLGDFGLGTVYNARVTVRVTDGSGKVTAYGSVIDQITQDPTYVPAQ